MKIRKYTNMEIYRNAFRKIQILKCKRVCKESKHIYKKTIK